VRHILGAILGIYAVNNTAEKIKQQGTAQMADPESSLQWTIPDK